MIGEPTRLQIASRLPQVLGERNINPARFVDAVVSCGGGRNAAYTLVKGETNVTSYNLLVAAHVLELPVSELFWLEASE